jgi:hypothetical protein
VALLSSADRTPKMLQVAGSEPAISWFQQHKPSRRQHSLITTKTGTSMRARDLLWLSRVKECANATEQSIAGFRTTRYCGNADTRYGRSPSRRRFSGCRISWCSRRDKTRLAWRWSKMGRRSTSGLAWRRRAMGRWALLSWRLLPPRLGMACGGGRCRNRRSAWCSRSLRLVLLSDTVRVERPHLRPADGSRLLARGVRGRTQWCAAADEDGHYCFAVAL